MQQIKSKRNFSVAQTIKFLSFDFEAKNVFRRTAETSVKINGDRDNEKFNIETVGIYIAAQLTSSSVKYSRSLHLPYSAKTKLFSERGVVVWAIELTNAG